MQEKDYAFKNEGVPCKIMSGNILRRALNIYCWEARGNPTRLINPGRVGNKGKDAGEWKKVKRKRKKSGQGRSDGSVQGLRIAKPKMMEKAGGDDGSWSYPH